jgi:hypothetical protein
LFTLHPETAQYYDAEDLDPDMVAKAQKFIMYGQSEMRYFFQLPQAFGQEAKWRTSLASFKEQFSDVGFPLQEFNVNHAEDVVEPMVVLRKSSTLSSRRWRSTPEECRPSRRAIGWSCSTGPTTT